MHLVGYLSRCLADVDVERAARETGVIVGAMSRLYKASRPRSGLMLGFASYPRHMIIPAARRLAT
jgi:hypothetical protein